MFRPNIAASTGAPIFTSTTPVNGNGDYNSGEFTPTAPGDYSLGAHYSGDANNAAADSPCGAPNETVSVAQATPQLTTNATPANATVGTPVHDVAHLSGGSSPTGTITYTLFGPHNAARTGAPIFTSTTPVNGNGDYN